MASRTGNRRSTRGGWVRMTPAEVIAFSDQSKQDIKRRVDDVIARHMKPLLFKRHNAKPSFGDVYDVYTKWRGHDLILIAKRRGGRLNNRRVDDFETKSGRLTLVGPNAFDLSYFRHTGRWWTIADDCTLKAALTFLRKPSPLWPW